MLVELGKKYKSSYTGKVVKITNIGVSNCQGIHITYQEKDGKEVNTSAVWFGIEYQPNNLFKYAYNKIKESRYIREFNWKYDIVNAFMLAFIVAMWSGFVYVVARTLWVIF